MNIIPRQYQFLGWRHQALTRKNWKARQGKWSISCLPSPCDWTDEINFHEYYVDAHFTHDKIASLAIQNRSWVLLWKKTSDTKSNHSTTTCSGSRNPKTASKKHSETKGGQSKEEESGVCWLRWTTSLFIRRRRKRVKPNKGYFFFTLSYDCIFLIKLIDKSLSVLLFPFIGWNQRL